MSSKFEVWKHDCTGHGQGEDRACDPPCDDPWQVDTPSGYMWDDEASPTFATQPEAVSFAVHTARTREHLVICPVRP